MQNGSAEGVLGRVATHLHVESSYQYIGYGVGIVTYTSRQPTGVFITQPARGYEEAGRLSLLVIL